MTKMRKLYRSGEKGFTLIELLVVIAILGAIAVGVVLNVGQFMGRGHDEAACTELHNVQTAVVAYMVDNNNTPPADVAALRSATPPLLLNDPAGTYTIDQSYGEVSQSAYDGGAACSSQ